MLVWSLMVFEVSGFLALLTIAYSFKIPNESLWLGVNSALALNWALNFGSIFGDSFNLPFIPSKRPPGPFLSDVGIFIVWWLVLFSPEMIDFTSSKALYILRAERVYAGSLSSLRFLFVTCETIILASYWAISNSSIVVTSFWSISISTILTVFLGFFTDVFREASF